MTTMAASVIAVLAFLPEIVSIVSLRRIAQPSIAGGIIAQSRSLWHVERSTLAGALLYSRIVARFCR
jgi:hypothetical protein